MSKILPFFLILTCFSVGCARKNFFQPTALVNPVAFRDAPTVPDSALVTVGRHYKKGPVTNLFFGKHYRELWATPVMLPVFDMKEAEGGLTPVSMGGGFQTTSLTLKDKQNRLFVLRSLDKDPIKTLPPFLQNTFVVNMVRDQTSAANPFAPLVLPRLSKAAGINYSTAKFYYIAENDSSFGSHAERVVGKVMLLEEKYDGKTWAPAFGNAVDVADSDDLLEDRFENNRHHIDQQLFARSRLFDILIGDWDRHEGQWQWAVHKNGNDYRYEPIPKDRDQTFYRFDDGLITWLVSSRIAVPKLQTFKKNYAYLPGWLYNARFIDERALHELPKEDWIRHAEELKAALTDEVILQAFGNLPKPVYQQNAEETMKFLRARRDKLPEAAAKIYQILAKEVTIPGTDMDERFLVTRMPSGDTKVEVFRKEKTDQTPFYSRTFKPQETSTIVLHGLGGKDEFEVTGKARKGITVNIYGGPGEDKLKDTSKVAGLRKKTRVYDTRRGMEVVKSDETNKHLTRDISVHSYDREGL